MYRLEKYKEEYSNIWDEFVLNQSINGTFLQTRSFLNYHPKDRFIDASIMVFDKNRLVAVVPACEIEDKYGVGLFSHKGTTFGGIILRKDYYETEKTLAILNTLDEYFKENYREVTLKITPDILSKANSDLLQYLLTYLGFENYIELNTYIDLKNLPTNIIDTFDRNKKRNILKCEEQNLTFREIREDKEIENFHELLTINLSKYGIKPIHSLDDIYLLKKERIPNNVKFYGVFKNAEMLAAGMMFVFPESNVIHAQNLSADYRFTEYSPITFLYYQIITQAKKDGYDYLTWGISTEDKGKKLNFGLIRNKESYGSKHQLNRTFYKLYCGNN